MRKRIGAAADNRADWLTHGRTYDEQRFSPLAAIDQGNVKDLKLAWYFDLDTKRGQEATPLVVDGTMYVTSAWSKVFALDARTGKEKWRFDPQVAGDKAIDACCDVVNRGVAAWGRSVFVGTLDGRLIALDMSERQAAVVGADDRPEEALHDHRRAARHQGQGHHRQRRRRDGRARLRVRVRRERPARCSGASTPCPAIRRTASRTRRWSAPRRRGPANGGSTAAAAPCGTRWPTIRSSTCSIIGVGNGSPWNHRIRSNGEGDNLFLSSIVALKPDTGEYVWHFQTTPAETWDYTATQHIILADLTIDGRHAQGR